MIEAVRHSAAFTTAKILAIRDLQDEFRQLHAGTSHGMSNVNFLNVLFEQPYCRIQNVMDRCSVQRPTASKWLEALVAANALTSMKIGRDRLFLNHRFLSVLADQDGLS